MNKNRKVFQTEKLNELQQQQKRAFLIFPAIMVVLLIWGGPVTIAELHKDSFVSEMLCLVLLLAFCSAMIGIVPFYMRYIRLQGQKKQVLENSSFITVNNLEYYRDKLEGITPGAISMLEDLHIEQDKDLTACILRYEMLGLIRQTEKTYERINEAAVKKLYLQESDWYLLKHLEKDDWNRELVIMDCTFLLLFFFPVLYMKFGQGRIQEQSPYKRTEKGEIYAEYIYGMKNFIHDYSNLNEAQKDALVLWDDYLIYAVLLEENKRIVEDIMKRRERI